MRNRAIIVALFLGAVGGVAAILIAVCFRDHRQFLYRQEFGEYAIEVWIDREADEAEVTEICCSYGKNNPGPRLVYGYAPVFLPNTFETTTFTTVVDTSNQLICVYDNGGYRFLMIVDQANHDWYNCGKSHGTHTEVEWHRHFQTLHKSNPGIPYGDYFESSDHSIAPN